jgi:hypothetical protein
MPDKGGAPSTAFSRIWAQAGKETPVARVGETGGGIAERPRAGAARLRDLHGQVPRGSHRFRRPRVAGARSRSASPARGKRRNTPPTTPGSLE